MIRSIRVGKSNLSNNRHILKIYYTCQQVLPSWKLQDKQQTCACTIRLNFCKHGTGSVVTLIETRQNWHCQKTNLCRGSTERRLPTAKLAGVTLLWMWTTYCHKKAVGTDATWQPFATLVHRLLLHSVHRLLLHSSGVLTGVWHHAHLKTHNMKNLEWQGY